MHVLILGGGVIGTSTAYYLARQGAQVTVLDRQPGPAQETSYANAGQVSPGYSTPWAAPGIPMKALKWLFQKHAPLAIHPDGTLHQLKWIAAMLANCSAGRYAVNKERMLRLAEYSRDCFRELRADTGIRYEERMGGTLQLFRTVKQMEAARRDMSVLEACGVPYELLSPDMLYTAEPALQAAAHRLAGGLRLPNDETGDCRLFTQRLAQLAVGHGAVFKFNQKIRALKTANGRLTGVEIGHEGNADSQVLAADRYVVALGSYSPGMLGPIGLRLPVYPVKGYSLTIPIVDAEKAPRSTILDETYKIAVTRFDDRIRVGGMAELNGYDLWLNPRRRDTLERVTNDLYPGAGDLTRAEFWTGLRPMTPDSTPIVGTTRYDNLFLNTGHGTLGWTMSCGSGRLVADLVMGRQPGISLAGLELSRYA